MFSEDLSPEAFHSALAGGLQDKLDRLARAPSVDSTGCPQPHRYMSVTRVVVLTPAVRMRDLSPAQRQFLIEVSRREVVVMDDLHQTVMTTNEMWVLLRSTWGEHRRLCPPLAAGSPHPTSSLNSCLFEWATPPRMHVRQRQRHHMCHARRWWHAQLEAAEWGVWRGVGGVAGVQFLAIDYVAGR